MTDELRNHLQRLDPMHSDVPVESPTTPSSRARLEHIMNTPLIENNAPSSDQPPTGRHSSSDLRRRRGWIAGGIAAAAVVAIGAAVVANVTGDDDPAEVAGPPLELSLGDSNTISSCMPFDTTILADMSPAFAATATEVADGTVTLDVDRWYAGGDAATVVLEAQQGQQALIAGFDFAVGQQYLITAAEGTVNFCGYSGPATPEFTAAFDAAFGG